MPVPLPPGALSGPSFTSSGLLRYPLHQLPSHCLHVVVWQVVSGLRGTNKALEARLEEVFNKRGMSMLNPDPDTSCTVWQQYGE